MHTSGGVLHGPPARRRRGVRAGLAAFGLTGLAAVTTALTGCGSSSAAAADTPQDCGTSHTAANVPVEVDVNRGQVPCSTALQVQAAYASAVAAGKAPGNGGGGPVKVTGWTCLGFPTPQLLKTGEISKCTKSGKEILAILKSATPGPSSS